MVKTIKAGTNAVVRAMEMVASRAIMAMAMIVALGAAMVTMTGCRQEEEKTVKVVAHRGFWDCEAAGYSENSIASLKAAQAEGFWGSEFDVQLTRDSVLIVNHNNDIDGLVIADHDWAELQMHLLPNGERRPLLAEYLAEGAKGVSPESAQGAQAAEGAKGKRATAHHQQPTVLVMELKAQRTEAQEDYLVEQSLLALEAAGLFDPARVAFISFSHHMCRRLAELAPGFTNQYLNGDKAPAELAADGINGIDYNYGVFEHHPEYIDDAHALGMSVNVWTVNDAEIASQLISAGVDAVTTNDPRMVRGLLDR